MTVPDRSASVEEVAWDIPEPCERCGTPLYLRDKDGRRWWDGIHRLEQYLDISEHTPELCADRRANPRRWVIDRTTGWVRDGTAPTAEAPEWDHQIRQMRP